MKLTEMRAWLERDGVLLSRGMGQNFLHDAHYLERIVELAEIDPADSVVEIGPGLGPLTERLLMRAKRVLAIEKDRDLCRLLRERLGGQPALDLVEGDALAMAEASPDWSGWLVVSNLPYSVGTPILVELARGASRPRRMVVTLQQEVVQRLSAVPHTRAYGLLTLLVSRTYRVGKSFHIPAGCFFPAPEVDSACVRLDRRETPLCPDARADVYEAIVRRGFSQRRKQMRRLLEKDWGAPAVEAAYAEAAVPNNARAEEVGPEQFAQLAALLEQGTKEVNR